MLILVLIDVQYSQKASFGFGKGSVGQKNPTSKISNPPHTPCCYLENLLKYLLCCVVIAILKGGNLHCN